MELGKGVLRQSPRPGVPISGEPLHPRCPSACFGRPLGAMGPGEGVVLLEACLGAVLHWLLSLRMENSSIISHLGLISPRGQFCALGSHHSLLS